MYSSTLLAIFTTAIAAATTSSEIAAALNTANLDKAVNLAASTEVADESTEKRGLGGVSMAKSAYTWCSALLKQNICYSCGSSSLGCSGACCRCGASTKISCSSC